MPMPKKYVPPPVDFKKKWNNGHKTLTAAEAKALHELLVSETSKQLNFQQNSHIMMRGRNPLTGEATPRTQTGEVVLDVNNKKYLGKLQGGNLILPEDRKLEDYVPPKQEYIPVGKIGVDEGKYLVLGNTLLDKGKAAQPLDLKAHAKECARREAVAKAEEEAMRTCKLKVMAKRREKKLMGEVAVLRRQAEEKDAEIRRLRETYG